MKLIDFLATAVADHNDALNAAKIFEWNPPEKRARLIRSYLIECDKWDDVRAIAIDLVHPMNNAAEGLIIAAEEDRVLDFDPDTDEGVKFRSMLQGFKAYGTINEAEENNILALGTYKPFEFKTLYEVLILREACPTKVVEAATGYVVIETSAECELHSPRILGQNPRTNKWLRVNNFEKVSSVGVYDAAIPTANLNWSLKVENPYDVII